MTTEDCDGKPAERATIKDVALRARVSLATVSRVLNDPARVSEHTAREVHNALRELNFRPNLTGRNLRANRTRTLGVVLPTLIHPVFAECLHGIETAARQRGYAICLATTGYEPEAEHAATELLLQHRMDGLVLTVADAANSRVLDKLDREQLPYLLVYNQLPPSADLQRPTVSVDNRAAARQVVEYLIASGHRQIRMVTGQFRQSDRARLRYHGYLDALTAAGMTAPPPIETSFMAADAQLPLQDMLSAAPRPTALFCSSDHLAMMVVRDLAALGVQVPQDLSVAGFDGTQLSALAVTPLTTVMQPSHDIGRTALNRLLDRIRGAPLQTSALLDHTLRIGGTTAGVASLLTDP